MSTDSELELRNIAVSLMQEIRAAQSTTGIARATANLWDGIARQLAPIIGPGGFDSLFFRSLQLTRASLPWLALADSLDLPQTRTIGLLLNLDARGADEALAASDLLLRNFIELIVAMIGGALTLRLLRPLGGRDTTHETTPESAE